MPDRPGHFVDRDAGLGGLPGAGDYDAQKDLLELDRCSTARRHATITVSLKDSAPEGCGITIGLASYSAPRATADDIERQVLVGPAGATVGDADRGPAR